MGFTKGSEGWGGVTFMKIKGLEKASPEHYFEVAGERVEDNKFSGQLIKIEPSSYEYEGKEKQTIKMTFKDDDVKYQLDISYNSISRNLINSIMGYLKEYQAGDLNMELSLYMDKNWYKSLGLLINGNRANWFYSWEEQKTLIERIENKKGELISNDYSAYDDKLKEGIGTINEFLNKNKPVDFDNIPF